MILTIVLKGTAEELGSPRAKKVRSCVQIGYPSVASTRLTIGQSIGRSINGTHNFHVFIHSTSH
jgi:hypothetical protein